MPNPNTPEQNMLVDKLQDLLCNKGVEVPESMMPLGDHRATLFRFLKARKFNVNGAAAMIDNTIRWRKENNIEGSLAEFLPDGKDAIIRQHLPSAMLGFTRAGQPLLLEQTGCCDLPGMEAAGISLEDFIFYHCRAMEYLVNATFKEASQRAGRLIDTQVVILDLSGLRTSMMTSNALNAFKKLASIYQSYYPELMSRMCVVNAPSLFSMMWRVLQMFIDERVKQKLQFLRQHELPLLHETIDPALLPLALGGTHAGKLVPDHGGFMPQCWLEADRDILRRQQVLAAQLSQQATEQLALMAAAADAPHSPSTSASPCASDSQAGIFSRRQSWAGTGPAVGLAVASRRTTLTEVNTPKRLLSRKRRRWGRNWCLCGSQHDQHDGLASPSDHELIHPLPPKTEMLKEPGGASAGSSVTWLTADGAGQQEQPWLFKAVQPGRRSYEMGTQCSSLSPTIEDAVSPTGWSSPSGTQRSSTASGSSFSFQMRRPSSDELPPSLFLRGGTGEQVAALLTAPTPSHHPACLPGIEPAAAVQAAMRTGTVHESRGGMGNAGDLVLAFVLGALLTVMLQQTLGSLLYSAVV